tara:strand:+ start:368 stop:739 length:372 start_codon:yes stop_codon:yes gene_type:complete
MELLIFLTLLIPASLLGALVYWFVKLLLKLPTSDKVIAESKSIVTKTKKTGSRMYKNLTTSKNNQIISTDNQLFAIANSEIKNSTQNEGLWVKSLVLAQGDKNKQKIEYIKLRVKELEEKKSK